MDAGGSDTLVDRSAGDEADDDNGTAVVVVVVVVVVVAAGSAVPVPTAAGALAAAPSAAAPVGDRSVSASLPRRFLVPSVRFPLRFAEPTGGDAECDGSKTGSGGDESVTCTDATCGCWEGWCCC